MNRRDILTAAATLAGNQILAHALRVSAESTPSLSAPSPTSRAAPADPLVLRNNDVEVAFDRKHGLPYSYRYRDQRLWGEGEGKAIEVILCRLEPRSYRTVTLESSQIHTTRNTVQFVFNATFEGLPAANFRLRYALDAATLTLTMEEVNEQHGFELIEAALPQLVVVREEDGPAWMSEGRAGGSFVRLEEARAFRFQDSGFFGRISTELPVGMVGQNGIGCVMEVTAFMDGTETEIRGEAGNRRALLGTIQTHRVHGGRCYDMNDGGPPVCGNANTPNLIVGQTPRARFNFFACAGQSQPWLTGAKIVRQRVPDIPTQFFSDRFLYIVAGKDKVEAKPRTTFAQSRQLIRDVAMLTDNAPQTVFISGWDYDGQDTGYPSEDKINCNLGTYQDLRRLMEDGKQWNANITLNTNYDDAYKSSPIFEEAFIARRPDGAIWKSRDWDGETSYVVGMSKFVEGGWGSRRIAYTMDRYRISDSILIDAMSWFAIRNDWDPRKPASGYKNLIEGKYWIVEEFHRHGVSVTSETLRYPFIGKLALTMNGPGISPCPFGGDPIPMAATIYRRAAIWGGSGDGSVQPQHEIFFNTRSALWFQADTDRMRIADFYFLVVLPFSKLHRLAVEDFESAGSVRRLILENSSCVMMDAANESYAAAVNGIEIARDDSTSCPVDANRIAFYSRTPRELRYPLPDGWDASKLKAWQLTLQGRIAHEVHCADGMIVVYVDARQPVTVYADGGTL
jgi:hypothetical protein